MRATTVQEYRPFIGTAKDSVDIEVGQLFVKLLRVSGFAKKEDGAWTPVITDAVVRLLGPNTTRGSFNPLMTLKGFPARVVGGHALSATALSPLYDPMAAPSEMIYECADAELGADARDDNGLMLPDWKLRHLIADKWVTSLATDANASSTKPDWRVRGISSVVVDHEEHKLSIVVREGVKTRVDHEVVSERTEIEIAFPFQGRMRGEPGKTHMRILFTSLV